MRRRGLLGAAGLALLPLPAVADDLDVIVLGAWCHAVPPAVASLIRAPHQERVFFAGEATESEKAGTIEAAWVSGLRAAAEAKAMLR